jgi:hypothetical protein
MPKRRIANRRTGQEIVFHLIATKTVMLRNVTHLLRFGTDFTERIQQQPLVNTFEFGH